MFGQSEENIERSSSFIIHQDLGSSVLCVVRRWKQRLTYVVQTCLLIKVIPFPERRNDWLNQSINPSRAVPRLCTDQKLVSYCCTMLYIVVVVSYDGLFWFAQCNAMNAMQWMQCKWIVDKSSCFQTFHIHEKLLVYYSYSLFITTTSTKTNTTRVKACKVK
jgi:hypothetical protein